MSRLSVVHLLRANAVSFSSVVQIGDSQEIHLSARVLAVQRQLEYVDNREFPLTFPILQKRFPLHQSMLNRFVAIRCTIVRSSLFILCALSGFLLHLSCISVQQKQ